MVVDCSTVSISPSMSSKLNLDAKELHYLCQETNRPTLVATWDYRGWVYRNSYCYSGSFANEQMPVVRAYSSGFLLRDTMKKRRIFDTAK